MNLSGDEISDAMHSSKDAELPSGELTGTYISLSIITRGATLMLYLMEAANPYLARDTHIIV